MKKIFSFNNKRNGSYIDSMSGVQGVNTNGEFKQTIKGLAYKLDTSTSLSFTVDSFDAVNLITMAGGNGTLRVAIGSTNTDIVLTGWSFDKTILSLTDETTVTFSCTSGTVYLSRCLIFDESISTDEENDLEKQFLRASPITRGNAGTKYANPASMITNLEREKEAYLKDITYNDFKNSDSFPYTTFTGDGTNGFSVSSEVSDIYIAGLENLNLVEGEKYHVTYNASLNCCEPPIARFQDGVAGNFASDNDDYHSVEGFNDVTYTITNTTYADGVFSFLHINDTADYTITDFTLQKLTGLVAAYNFNKDTVKTDKVLDISGNQNDATYVGNPLLTMDGLKFDGVDDEVVVSDDSSLDFGTGSFSLLMRGCFTKNTATQGLLNKKPDDSDGVGWQLVKSFGSSGFFRIADGTNEVNTFFGDLSNPVATDIAVVVNRDTDEAYFYQDGELVETLDISSITGSVSNANDLYLMSRRGVSNYAEGALLDVRTLNRPLSEQEVKDYHNSFVQTVVSEKFEDDAVGETDPIGRLKGTGSYEVKEKTDGTKYLECTSAGTKPFQSDTAYGEWEFYAYVNAGSPSITILSDRNAAYQQSNSYNLYLFNGDDIRLYRSTVGGNVLLFRTAPSYISTNTWYKIKTTRTTDGEFTVYIKGGDFGDTYQLVDVTEGSGTNPVTDTTYTESKFFVVDNDVGDSIANINIKNWVRK